MVFMASKIMDALIARLEADGPARWVDVARQAGCRSLRLPAKLVYGSRETPPSRGAPRVETIEPLLIHYKLVSLAERPRRRRRPDRQPTA